MGEVKLFYGISALSAIIMLYIVIVSFIIRKMPGWFHPDSVLILLSFLIGMYFYYEGGTPIEDMIDKNNLRQIIIPVLFAEFFSTPKSSFSAKKRFHVVTFIFTIVLIIVTYYFLEMIHSQLSETLYTGTKFNKDTLFLVSALLNLQDMTAIRVISKNLSHNAQSTFCSGSINNVALTLLLAYTVELGIIDKDTSVWNGILTGFIVFVSSFGYGLASGIIACLILKYVPYIRESPMNEVIYLVNILMIFSSITPLLPKQINGFWAALVYSMIANQYMKLSFSPQASQKIIYFVQLVTIVMKSAILIMIGFDFPNIFQIKSLKSLGVMILILLAIRLPMTIVQFMAISFTDKDLIKRNLYSFVYLFFTGVTKGTLVFMVIITYFEGEIAKSLKFIVFLGILITPLSWWFTKNNRVTDMDEQDNDNFLGSPDDKIANFLIYDYRNRLQNVILIIFITILLSIQLSI